MVEEGRGIQESWEDFGRNLQGFLVREDASLKETPYNVILGFTRGGAILATALASQLAERYPDLYSDPWTGAIRTIPNGIHKKLYDRPDFVMGSPCAEEDLRDLGELGRELGAFRRRHKLERVSVLLVDDNLTGSTRMKFFKDSLAGIGFVDVDLLAYARNPSIEVPRIDYFVRADATRAAEYLIMP
jgi:hypothetical protein